jgi:hypothetical protein
VSFAVCYMSEPPTDGFPGSRLLARPAQGAKPGAVRRIVLQVLG